MKKLAAFLAILAVLTLTAVPVRGEGIYVSSESGDEIRILEDAEVAGPVRGNVIAALGDVLVESRVDGHVVAVFGDVEIDAEVTGLVVALFGKVTLKDGAKIAGDVISIGSLERYPGAVIGGKEVRIFGKSMDFDMDAISYLRLTILVLFMVAVLLTGLLTLLVSRNKYRIISRNLEKNPGRKLVLGILSFIGATSLLAILLLTLVAPLLYIVLMVISTVPACIYIGRQILKAFSQKNSIYIEFITGLITTTLIKLVALLVIPGQNLLLAAVVSGIINFLVFSFGMGILMEHRYLQNNRESAPNGT